MKIQDIGFFVIFVLLLISRNPRLSVIAGILSLFLSIPLFAAWIFFTAERLTWYAGAFFLLSVFFYLTQKGKE